MTKEENIWWRDQIETDMEYNLLSDVGLDFNQEKMYQSGFEFRSFGRIPYRLPQRRFTRYHSNLRTLAKPSEP